MQVMMLAIKRLGAGYVFNFQKNLLFFFVAIQLRVCECEKLQRIRDVRIIRYTFGFGGVYD